MGPIYKAPTVGLVWVELSTWRRRGGQRPAGGDVAAGGERETGLRVGAGTKATGGARRRARPFIARLVPLVFALPPLSPPPQEFPQKGLQPSASREWSPADFRPDRARQGAPLVCFVLLLLRLSRLSDGGDEEEGGGRGGAPGNDKIGRWKY